MFNAKTQYAAWHIASLHLNQNLHFRGYLKCDKLFLDMPKARTKRLGVPRRQVAEPQINVEEMSSI